MDGDGGVGGRCFISRFFLDFDFFLRALWRRTPLVCFFCFLLWSGLLLLVIFFLRHLRLFLILLAELICSFGSGCRYLNFSLFLEALLPWEGWLGC